MFDLITASFYAGNEGSGSSVEQGLSDFGASNGVDAPCTFRSFSMLAAVTLLLSSLLNLSALSHFLLHACCFIFFSFIFGAIFFSV